MSAVHRCPRRACRYGRRAKQSTASEQNSRAGTVPEYDAWNPRGQSRAAVMSEPQSARSELSSARESGHPADPTLLLKLQQTATLANENCDRATALVRTVSAELRDAHQRIRDLEREANRRLEAEAALAQLQAEFEARVDQAKREAQRRVSQRLAEAEAVATLLFSIFCFRRPDFHPRVDRRPSNLLPRTTAGQRQFLFGSQDRKSDRELLN
jgi:hypothetical protein